MVRTADPKYAAAGLIVAAYHAGIQSPPFQTPAYPTEAHRDLVKTRDSGRLLAEAEDAIRSNNQGRSAAAIEIYGERGYPVEPVFDLMLKYAVSEDGRLHGEKYFHTVREEYRYDPSEISLAADCRSRARHGQRLRLQPRRQARFPCGWLRRRMQTARRRSLSADLDRRSWSD